MEDAPEECLKHSDPENSFSRFDLLDQVIGYFAVDIDDVIGNVAPALVDHVGDVKLVVGHEMRDLLDHARRIQIADGDSLLAGSVKKAFGEVDRILDVPVFQEIHNLFDRHKSAVFFGLLI